MTETEERLPPGVTLDPKDQAELESAFGVSSNAEELVRMNATRYSPDFLAAQRRRVDPGLSSTLYTGQTEVELDEHGQIKWGADAFREFAPELEEVIGHPVTDAAVRGSGRQAAIVYVFAGPRGGLEKDFIPYADFEKAIGGSKKSKTEGKQGSQSSGSGATKSEDEPTGASGPKRRRSPKK